MKKLTLLLFVLALAIQGCSRQTRGDLKEIGRDIEGDANKAVN